MAIIIPYVPHRQYPNAKDVAREIWAEHDRREEEAERQKAIKMAEEKYESELTDEESSQLFEDIARYLFDGGQDD